MKLRTVIALAALSVMPLEVRPVAAAPDQASPAPGAARQATANPRDPVANFEYAWNRLDRNYAQFGAKHVDWEALRRVYRAKVTPATTDEELWNVLMAMIRNLNDAHVCLQAGPRRECGGLFEGVKPQGFSRDLVKSKYLQGKATEAIKGKVTYGWLAPDIGYLHIFDFKGSPDPIYQAVDAAVAQFATARALVVDVRENTGGTGRTAEAAAGRFADTKRQFMRTRTRYGRKHDDLLPPDYRNVVPSGPSQFTRPTVLLTDRFTASAAEGFTLAMRVQPHVTVVGDLTEGAFSAQAPDRMPNGWTLWVAFHVATDHNGVNWDGVGIPPDLRIVNTAADVAAGVDRPIEFALDLLDKGAPAPQDESSSLATLKTSMVLTYLETVREKGAAAAEAEMKRMRADRSGRYFFSPDEAMQQAGPLLGRKQYAEAIPLLVATRDEVPQFAAAYAMLAQAYLGSGNLAAAEATMARGEKVEPMVPWAEVAQIAAAKTAIRKQKFGSAALILEKALAEGGVASADRAFGDLLARRDRGGPVIDEGDFNALGYKLLKAKNTEGAIFVFEKNAALHPTSGNAWDSLGEAQAEAGRLAQAIDSYRKAVALDPANSNARARLKELEKTAPPPAQSIFEAVKTGTPGQVQAMAAKDASLVNAKDAAGKTPLHHAANGGSVPMIECLLSLGAAIDAATTENLTPLLEAVRSGKDAAANALIDKGAKTDGVLHWAARLNRTAVIETLIAKGADLEARDPQGFTPLTSAARMGGGPFEAIELLVRKGANFNLPDSLGNTPLDNAIIYGGADSRTIDLLLARSAAVNTEPAALASTLSAAARRGHVRLFDYYLARGGEASLANESTRRSVMRSATMGGALEMVKALQAKGIPLDLAPNRNGATPLHSLASNPKALDMVEFLVRNGADVNARTNDGRSAYNIADAAGNRSVAAVLLRLGASPDPQQFPRLAGPYLGQTPPADELRPFAPGIVYLDHGTVSVSPDGQEMYWPTGTAIMTTRFQDGRWTKPAFAPFSGPSEIAFHDDVPFVTPDNKRLFFTSKRPVAPGAPEKENIWFVERTPTGWSEPRSVGPAVNAMSLHWQVSVSNAGTLYFGGRREKDGFGAGDIYCSRLENGQYTEPVNLGPAVNTKDGESQVFVAPDESFLLFWRAPGQIPSAFVSFKGSDGRWLPAVKFDLPWAGAGLSVSPDGKYLFTGGQWKSTRFLEELRRRAR